MTTVADHESSSVTLALAVTGTMIMIVIILIVIIIIAIVIVRKYGQSKVVLQVTGDSIDIAGKSHFPSIIVQRYNDNYDILRSQMVVISLSLSLSFPPIFSLPAFPAPYNPLSLGAMIAFLSQILHLYNYS